MPRYDEPSTVEAMVRLARIQSAFIRARAPNEAGGGRLIVAELTRKEMRISSPCTLS